MVGKGSLICVVGLLFSNSVCHVIFGWYWYWFWNWYLFWEMHCCLVLLLGKALLRTLGWVASWPRLAPRHLRRRRPRRPSSSSASQSAHPARTRNDSACGGCGLILRLLAHPTRSSHQWSSPSVVGIGPDMGTNRVHRRHDYTSIRKKHAAFVSLAFRL